MPVQQFTEFPPVSKTKVRICMTVVLNDMLIGITVVCSLVSLNMPCSHIRFGVGNCNVFISLFKQRLTDNYVQNINARL